MRECDDPVQAVDPSLEVVLVLQPARLQPRPVTDGAVRHHDHGVSARWRVLRILRPRLHPLEIFQGDGIANHGHGSFGLCANVHEHRPACDAASIIRGSSLRWNTVPVVPTQEVGR